MALKDIRPYVLYAHIQWLDESGAIPHLVITNGENVEFPPHLKSSPGLAFNVSSEAVQGLMIDENGISFTGRFNGKATTIYAPLNSIAKLYSADNTVQIDLKIPEMKQAQDSSVKPELVEQPPIGTKKPVFTIIQGGNKGTGIPIGNLSSI